MPINRNKLVANAVLNAGKPARKLTATPTLKREADAPSKPAPAIDVKPSKPKLHAGNTRQPAYVRTLFDGVSANDAKKLRGKLRAAFAPLNGGVNRGSWQQYAAGNDEAMRAIVRASASEAKRLAAELAARVNGASSTSTAKRAKPAKRAVAAANAA